MSKTKESKSPAKKKANPTRVNLDSGEINQPEMKTSEIRDLIDFISKSGLNEVNIETKELKLSVKREPDQKVFKSTPVVTAPAAAVAFPSLPVATPTTDTTPPAPAASYPPLIPLSSPPTY